MVEIRGRIRDMYVGIAHCNVSLCNWLRDCKLSSRSYAAVESFIYFSAHWYAE
jgi:hypothetical protein